MNDEKLSRNAKENTIKLEKTKLNTEVFEVDLNARVLNYISI